MRPLPTLCLLSVLLCACTSDVAPRQSTGLAAGQPAAAPDEAVVSINPAATGGNKPNILLIVADDLGWADLNCYGSYLVESPNLDRLARGGLQFMQGYAAAPLGTPTRASIQTGLYPARIGLTGNPAENDRRAATALKPPALPKTLGADFTTIAELAKSAGYRTAHLGKWSLGKNGTGPAGQGYDLSFDATEAEGATTDALGAKALDQIKEWTGAPWLISLNFYAPHVPLAGRQDWVQYYRSLIDSTHWRPFPTVEYAAMISNLDENVGRITDYLEANGQLENTLIIFVSDNGGLHVAGPRGQDRHTPPTDNGILREGKGFLYEGGIRIPFILHYPELTEGRNASLTPVITNDIFPTIAEAIGRSGAYNSGDGLSLLPLLRGEELPRRNLYWHFPHYSPQGGRPAAAVRSEGFKMYLDYESGEATYYNVGALPSENLMIAEPPGGGKMRHALQTWKNSVGAVEAERR